MKKNIYMLYTQLNMFRWNIKMKTEENEEKKKTTTTEIHFLFVGSEFFLLFFFSLLLLVVSAIFSFLIHPIRCGLIRVFFFFFNSYSSLSFNITFSLWFIHEQIWFHFYRILRNSLDKTFFVSLSFRCVVRWRLVLYSCEYTSAHCFISFNRCGTVISIKYVQTNWITTIGITCRHIFFFSGAKKHFW